MQFDVHDPQIILVDPRAIKRYAFQTTRRARVDALIRVLPDGGIERALCLVLDITTGRARLHHGHHRLQAALELGLPVVPVVVYPIVGRFDGDGAPFEPLQGVAWRKPKEA